MPDVFDSIMSSPQNAPAQPARTPDVFDRVLQNQGIDPVKNFVAGAYEATAAPLGKAILRGATAVGLQSPETLKHDLAATTGYDPDTASGFAGNLVGSVGAAIGEGPLAPIVAGVTGGEHGMENVEARRAAGQDVSSGQAYAEVLGHGALDAVATYAGGKAGRALFGAGEQTAEQTAAKLAQRTLAERLGRSAGAGLLGAGEMGALGVAGNALDLGTGVAAPNQTLMTGVPLQAATGFGLAGLTHGIHQEGRMHLGNKITSLGEPVTPGADLEAVSQESAQKLETISQEAAQKNVLPVDESKPEKQSGPGRPHTEKSDVRTTPEELARIQAETERIIREQGGHQAEDLPPAREGAAQNAESAKDKVFAQALKESKSGLDVKPDERITVPEGAAPVGKESNPLAKAILKRGFEDEVPHGELTSLQKAAGEQAVRESEGLPAPKPDEFNRLPGEKSEPKEETFFQRMQRIGAQKAQELPANEEGWDKTTQAFVNRDVIPTAKKVGRGIVDLAKSIDRHLDAGFTHTKAGDETRLDFRKMQGQATIAGHKFEADLAATGARELAPKFSDVHPVSGVKGEDAIREWEHWENGGLAKTPEERAAQDLIRALRQENAVRAKKVGVTLKDEEGEALSRIYEFPEDHGEQPGKPGSLAGREAYRKSQKIASFGDSLRAAEAAGGKIKYDSLIDAQTARQYELGRSLSAREALRNGEDKGRYQWVPETSRPGDTLNTKINDPIATETRQAAVPSQLAGRLGSRLEGGHYAGEDLIKQHQDDIVYVRPGEDAPTGYTKIAHQVKGTYHGDSDSAHALNSMMKVGSRDPVTELPSKIANATLGLHYSMSVVHAINGAIGSIENDLGRAFGLGGADAQSRSQSIRNLMTGGVSKWIKGNRAIRNIESGGREFPGLTEAAQRATESGDLKMRFKSVLDKSKFKDAINEFKNYNVIGGAGRMFDAVVHRMHDAIFHDVLDRLQMGGMVERAEQDIRQGTSREAGAAKLANANDVMARSLGRTVTSPEFKNSVVTAAARIVMPAIQYRTGLLRNLGAAIRGNPEAQAQAVGHVMTTLIGSALGGMAVRAALTGKIDPPKDLRDWLGQPRTGGQDDQGNATRFSLPGTSSFTRRMLLGEGTRGLTNELTGMLHPAIRGGYETLANKDYYGNQVRPEGWSGLATPSAVGHTLEGALPMSMTNALNDSDKKHGPGERALQSLTGINISHPVTSNAKQYLYDTLNETQHKGRTPEQAERHTNEARWAEMIRTHDPDQIRQAQEEMAKDPGMGAPRQQSIFRRAAAKKGLAGLLGDSQFGPDHLMEAWDRMTDTEKEDSKEAIMARLSKAKPKDRETLQQWLALRDAVTGGGK